MRSSPARRGLGSDGLLGGPQPAYGHAGKSFHALGGGHERRWYVRWSRPFIFNRRDSDADNTSLGTESAPRAYRQPSARDERDACSRYLHSRLTCTRPIRRSPVLVLFASIPAALALLALILQVRDNAVARHRLPLRALGADPITDWRSRGSVDVFEARGVGGGGHFDVGGATARSSAEGARAAFDNVGDADAKPRELALTREGLLNTAGGVGKDAEDLRVMISTTTADSLGKILDWVDYHKLVGVDDFFVFVEGNAAAPEVVEALRAAGVEVADGCIRFTDVGRAVYEGSPWRHDTPRPSAIALAAQTSAWMGVVPSSLKSKFSGSAQKPTNEQQLRLAKVAQNAPLRCRRSARL